MRQKKVKSKKKSQKQQSQPTQQEPQDPQIKKKKSFKQRIPEIIFGFVFLIGLAILLYPTIADQWNKYRQSRLISDYQNVVGHMDTTDIEKEFSQAEAYNASLTYDVFGGDAFDDKEEDIKNTEYWKMLNLGGDGIIGSVSIPKIHQDIPIYHGTSEEVLQKGAGHLSGTMLPIGGEGTHSVLAAHRGLPSAKLFSDVDKLVVGDKFYIHILNEVHAYQVDQILPMIKKDDQDALREALALEAGQDYVSLFTCTPYGVNSHRLIVRGHRVEYNGEEEPTGKIVDTMLESVQNYYMLYVILGLAVTILALVIIRFISKKKENKKQ